MRSAGCSQESDRVGADTDGRSCRIISLSKLIEAVGRDDAQAILDRYRSVRDSSTEEFLRRKAVDMELRDVSRTYIALSPDGRVVLGYITLSIKCLSVPVENVLNGSTLRRMNIESRTGIAQSYLLGQLSRSADAPKGFGETLLDAAFEKLSSAKALVGCRMVRLDCHDELIPYYSSHGFRLIRENDERTLNQMMAFVRPLRTRGPSLAPRISSRRRIWRTPCSGRIRRRAR